MKIDKNVLIETTLGDKIDNKTVVDVSDESKKSAEGDIEKALDEMLDTARFGRLVDDDEYQALMIIGPAGIGKTARINSWARKNNINLTTVLTSGLDDGDVGGALIQNKDTGEADKLPASIFNGLDRPNSVLFLDEYNRGSMAVRNTLLYLINDHKLPDQRPQYKDNNGFRKFDNLLFVVLAQNPDSTSSDGYGGTGEPLERAEKSRMWFLYATPSPRVQRFFMENKFTDQIKKLEAKKDSLDEQTYYRYLTALEGRMKIASTLLSSSSFQFDTDQETLDSEENGNGLGLDSRNLAKLLNRCNGTKQDFLKKWDSQCNSLKKPVVQQILANYTDVDNKANQALRRGTDSKFISSNGDAVFGRKQHSVWDDVYPHLKD